MSTNGLSEEDSRGGHDQICCLVDDGHRCARLAGNASYSKRIQKTVQQRRLKLNIDHSVSVVHILSHFQTSILEVQLSTNLPVQTKLKAKMFLDIGLI